MKSSLKKDVVRASEKLSIKLNGVRHMCMRVGGGGGGGGGGGL